jgi:hypothetical protein
MVREALLVHDVNEISLAEITLSFGGTGTAVAISNKQTHESLSGREFCSGEFSFRDSDTGTKELAAEEVLVQDELFDGESQRTDLVGILVQDDYTNLGGHGGMVLFER